MDNDPEDLSQPYAGLADGMREFNREIYPLADHFETP